MNYSSYRITLDNYATSSQIVLNAKEQESGRKIYISLTDGSMPYHIEEGCRAVFTAEKPDATLIYNDCQIDGDVIIYTITKQTTAAVGFVACEIKLYDKNDVLLISPRFGLLVEKSVFNDQDMSGSGNEFNAIADLINHVVQQYLENNPLGVDKTLTVEGKAADAMVTGQGISKAKNIAANANTNATAAINAANEIKTAVVDAQNAASTAQIAASNAASSASLAQTAANNAQDTANEAKKTAQEAYDAISNSSGSAGSAVLAAQQAMAAATEAAQSADAAQLAAQAAQQQVGNMQNSINAAQDAASGAQNTADSAKDTANAAKTTADKALPKTGGNMTGNINMGTYYGITNMKTPVNRTDAANKGYVDDKIPTLEQLTQSVLNQFETWTGGSY